MAHNQPDKTWRKQLSEVKYLGFLLDAHLKFDMLKKMGATVKGNMHTFNPSDIANIFSHAVLLPHLSYCVASGSRASITKPWERLNCCEFFFFLNIEQKAR